MYKHGRRQSLDVLDYLVNKRVVVCLWLMPRDPYISQSLLLRRHEQMLLAVQSFILPRTDLEQRRLIFEHGMIIGNAGQTLSYVDHRGHFAI